MATSSSEISLSKSVEFLTTMDGRRQVRRYVPSWRGRSSGFAPRKTCGARVQNGDRLRQDLVIAMAMVCRIFISERVPVRLVDHFLIVAPTSSSTSGWRRISAATGFSRIPLIRRNGRGTWSQKVILRGESTLPDPSGNVFLTNVHQLYESGTRPGRRRTPSTRSLARAGCDLSAHDPSMLEAGQGIEDWSFSTTEAHHVHDEDLAWSRRCWAFTATCRMDFAVARFFRTPKRSTKNVITPGRSSTTRSAQAVEDRIVKAPIIVTKENDAKQPAIDPDGTKENVRRIWLTDHAAVKRWKEPRDDL